MQQSQVLPLRADILKSGRRLVTVRRQAMRWHSALSSGLKISEEEEGGCWFSAVILAAAGLRREPQGSLGG